MLANLPAGPYAVTIQRDLCYAEHHPRLLLDIMQPNPHPDDTSSTPPRPLIVQLHGGGYVQGAKQIELTHFLATRGWVTASINYRLSKTAPFPAALEDATAAINWLRQQADTHGIDPTRIGVWGISAGGHLAASLLTMSPVALQAVSITAGYMDLLARASSTEAAQLQQLLAWMLNTNAELDDDDIRALSPRYHIPSTPLPPVHLVHGTADDVVPYSQSTEFVMALREAGHSAELDTIPGAGHGFEQGAWFQVEQGTLSFFERVLPPAG